MIQCNIGSHCDYVITGGKPRFIQALTAKLSGIFNQHSTVMSGLNARSADDGHAGPEGLGQVPRYNHFLPESGSG